MPFIPRAEKASWGIPCNQNADGELFVGKGFEKTLESQLGNQVAREVAHALQQARGDRNGRFWIDLETRAIRMAVGDSAANRYARGRF